MTWLIIGAVLLAIIAYILGYCRGFGTMERDGADELLCLNEELDRHATALSEARKVNEYLTAQLDEARTRPNALASARLVVIHRAIEVLKGLTP